MVGNAPNQYSGIDVTALGKAVKKAADKVAPKLQKAQNKYVAGRMKQMRADATEKLGVKKRYNQAQDAQAQSLMAREQTKRKAAADAEAQEFEQKKVARGKQAAVNKRVKQITRNLESGYKPAGASVSKAQQAGDVVAKVVQNVVNKKVKKGK